MLGGALFVCEQIHGALRTLEREQCALDAQAAAEPGERAVSANDPMTGHDDWQRIRTVCESHPARSPAQSPLPGHLLAALGPAGHATAIALLAAAGVALVVSLLTASPSTPARAATLIALMIGALLTHLVRAELPRLIPPLILGGLAFLVYSWRLPGSPEGHRHQGGVTGTG